MSLRISEDTIHKWIESNVPKHRPFLKKRMFAYIDLLCGNLGSIGIALDKTRAYYNPIIGKVSAPIAFDPRIMKYYSSDPSWIYSDAIEHSSYYFFKTFFQHFVGDTELEFISSTGTSIQHNIGLTDYGLFSDADPTDHTDEESSSVAMDYAGVPILAAFMKIVPEKFEAQQVFLDNLFRTRLSIVKPARLSVIPIWSVTYTFDVEPGTRMEYGTVVTNLFYGLSWALMSTFVSTVLTVKVTKWDGLSYITPAYVSRKDIYYRDVAYGVQYDFRYFATNVRSIEYIGHINGASTVVYAISFDRNFFIPGDFQHDQTVEGYPEPLKLQWPTAWTLTGQVQTGSIGEFYIDENTGCLMRNGTDLNFVIVSEELICQNDRYYPDIYIGADGCCYITASF